MRVDHWRRTRRMNAYSVSAALTRRTPSVCKMVVPHRHTKSTAHRSSTVQSVSVGTPNPCAIDATRLVGTAHPAAICLATVSSARATASRDRILPPVGAQSCGASRPADFAAGRSLGNSSGVVKGRLARPSFERGVSTWTPGWHNLPPLTDGANLPFTRALSRASCCDLILRLSCLPAAAAAETD